MQIISFVIPVYNEEEWLASSVIHSVKTFRSLFVAYDWKLVIVDNASTDNTGSIGKQLKEEYEEVNYLHISERGKGIAIRRGWEAYPADIYGFFDVDLSTRLEDMLPLVQAVETGETAVACASRFAKGARVHRPIWRKIISRGYRFLLQRATQLPIQDAPCGCKVVSKEIVEHIVPQVENKGFFFDSELLIRAHQAGYVLKEFPVEWREHKKRKSTVGIVATVLSYVRELGRLRTTRKKF